MLHHRPSSTEKTGTNAFTKKTVSGITSSYLMKNLLANTAYEWEVRSVCTGYGKTANGAFSTLQHFTTASQKLGGIGRRRNGIV
jgi:hypothetical protein